jgi:hypothetical protein
MGQQCSSASIYTLYEIYTPDRINVFYVFQQHNYKMIYCYLLSQYTGSMPLIFMHKKSSQERRVLLSWIWRREDWQKFTDVSEEWTGSICIIMAHRAGVPKILYFPTLPPVLLSHNFDAQIITITRRYQPVLLYPHPCE